MSLFCGPLRVMSVRSFELLTVPVPLPCTAYETNSTLSPAKRGSLIVMSNPSVAIYSVAVNLTPLTNTSR